MYRLYIANKNYSSWSLRPWILMRELQLPFEEHLLRFGDAPAWSGFRRLAPSGKVPLLIDGEVTVWESLAIIEYLAERHSAVWPSDPLPRAWARSAAAEMHAGFTELRNRCSMSCGVRIRLRDGDGGLERDLERLQSLWGEGLSRFGGPFLAGPRFTAVDAFFAPVAFRVQTYGLRLDAQCSAYVSLLLQMPAMQAWYGDALKEQFRDVPHEQEITAVGALIEDLRAGGQRAATE